MEFGVIMGFKVKDAQLKGTLALPSGASSVYGAAIKLDNTSRGQFMAGVEWLITAPALVVGKLADASTMKYSVTISANADGSSPTIVYPDVIVQTGAGGAGAVGATKTVRLPLDVTGYVALKITNSASADASAVAATLEALL
jgi:hypothetical protein